LTSGTVTEGYGTGCGNWFEDASRARCRVSQFRKIFGEGMASRRFVLCGVFLWVFLTCADGSVSASAAGFKAMVSRMLFPLEDQPAGVRYRRNNKEWVELEPGKLLSTTTKGIPKFLATVGLSGLNLIYVYQGARASLQIADKRPTFHVCGPDFAREALIVQLTTRETAREIQTVSDAATYDNKPGFRQSDIRRTVLTPISDRCFAVTPEATLKTGEYLLVLGSVTSAYEFGITQNE